MSALPRVDLRGVVLPMGLLIAGEIYARATNLHSDALAAPSDILMSGVRALADGSMLYATLQTLASAGLGLIIGFSVGLTLGVFMGLIAPLNRLLEITIEILRPVPSVALIPIALMAYGFGYRMEFAVVAFGTVWPALILTRSAIAGIELRLLEVSRALQLSLVARIFKIVIPAALPRIFVALRLAVGISLIVAVTVEVTTNPIGVGYRMMEASQTLRPGLALAYLVWIGILGWALNWLMLLVQKHAFGPAANAEALP
jgi:NitT/TauT family transport system permease protein